ncbi:hypothetical protein W02_24660 [Nitrospira sp. KM1]|uniref:hypothetical protein n=1 Tax=Nitrospira sp. KM1 TaxID=1936990 RepID=UPI0013A76E4C|nr:hypothetical protein [Nitrospira sp. KM1]BCA55326.1 hypothetical protein W02_24660 [Nitrospira sp. KM1]
MSNTKAPRFTINQFLSFFCGMTIFIGASLQSANGESPTTVKVDTDSTSFHVGNVLNRMEAIKKPLLKLYDQPTDMGFDRNASSYNGNLSVSWFSLYHGFFDRIEVSPEEFKVLGDQNIKLIRALDESVDAKFELWTAVYPERDQSSDPVIRANTKRQLNIWTTAMCGDFKALGEVLSKVHIENGGFVTDSTNLGERIETAYAPVIWVCQKAAREAYYGEGGKECQ